MSICGGCDHPGRSQSQEYWGENLGGIVSDAARAFPDMHQELYDFYVSGDVAVVELSLNGTHTGPLETPGGSIGATGKEFHAPCCDLRSLTQTLQS